MENRIFTKLKSSKYIFPTIIGIVVFIGFMLKTQISIVETSDRVYYLRQLEVFYDVGYFFAPDNPVPLYVLLGVDMILKDGYTALLYAMIVFSTLIALPISLILKNKDKLAVIVGVLVILFRDYFYIMINYGIWKNIFGMFIYSTFLLVLYRYENKHDIYDLGSIILLCIVQVFTHELAFSLQVLTLGYWFIISKTYKKLLKLFVDKPLIGVVFSFSIGIFVYNMIVNPNLHYLLFLRPENFAFNFVRFYEAFSWLPVTGQLIVFCGTIMLGKNMFDRTVAFTGITLHICSWLLFDGMRMLYLTQVPLAVCLASLLTYPRVKEHRWLLVFLATCFILPYIGRFVGRYLGVI